MKTKNYEYEWTTADEILANKDQKRNFPGWGEMTLAGIAGFGGRTVKTDDYKNAHELWLKLKEAFNTEAATYEPEAYNSELGSIGAVEQREVMRSAWWELLDGDNYGEYRVLTSIIEALHHGEKLETGEIIFGS